MSGRLIEIRRRMEKLSDQAMTEDFDDMLELSNKERKHYLNLTEQNFSTGVIDTDEYRMFNRVLNNWESSDDLSKQVTFFVLHSLEQLDIPTV